MTLPSWSRPLLAVTGAVVLTIGVAAISQAPYRPYRPDESMLRLAWSARPERIETCRRQTEEELEKWPPHMRQLVVCEGNSARYQLEVRVDGTPVLVDTARGGGARRDRPLYVLREAMLSPGAIRLEVRFTRIDHPSLETELEDLDPDVAAQIRVEQERREAAERERRREEAIPPVLVFDSIVRVEPRAVVVVTYDRLLRRLVARTGGSDGS